MRARLAIGALGVLAGAYGALLLIERGFDSLLATALWLAGGVLVHDGLVGLLLVAAGVGVAVTVPARVRAPIAAGLVVLGTVTITAIPVLGRFGARPDNATLLDRNYLLGWLVLALLVVLATLAGVALRLRADPSRRAPSSH